MDIGQILDDRFRIEASLGEGGIGRVWLAIDLQSSSSDANNYQKVVIKELKETKDEYILAKFRKEIAALKKITHSSVVKFLAEGTQPNGTPYLVIEYISGRSLRKQIVQGGISDLTRIANIAKQLGEAISAAHDNGVYHRDLKPENIMLCWQDNDELIKVIDFGIATVKEHIDEPTKTTAIIGTVDYMSSEQINGKPNSSTDIYAMAVIIYEMLTGALPFNVKTLPTPANVIKLLALQKTRSFANPTTLRPDISEQTAALISQALSINAKDRPARADIFGNEIYNSLMKDDLNEEVPLQQSFPRLNTHSATNKFQGKHSHDDGDDLIPGDPISNKKLSDKETISEIHKNFSEIVKPPSVIKNNYNKPIIIIIGIIVLISSIAILNKTVFNSTNIINRPEPQPTTTPVITNKQPLLFSYSISLSEYVSNNHYKPPIQLAGEQIIFNDKDLIKFNFTTQSTGYLYIINESPLLKDNLPQYTMLFPTTNENHKLQIGQRYIIPSAKDDPGIEFSGSKGVEKIWLVFSKEKNLKLEKLTQTLTEKELGKITDIDNINYIQQLLNRDYLVKPEIDDTRKCINLAINEKDATIALLKLLHN